MPAERACWSIFFSLADWRPQTVCAFGMGKGGKTRTPLTELSTAVGEGLTGGRGVHCERQEHCLEVMIRLHDTDSKGRTDGRYLHVAVDACIPLLELAIHPRSLFNLLYSLSGFLDQLRNYQPYRSSNGVCFVFFFPFMILFRRPQGRADVCLFCSGDSTVAAGHGTSSSRPVSSEASGSRGASIQVPVFPDLDDPEDGGRCAQSSLCEDAGALKPWSMDIHIQGQVDADLWELYRLISHMEMSSFHISIDRHSNIDIRLVYPFVVGGLFAVGFASEMLTHVRYLLVGLNAPCFPTHQLWGSFSVRLCGEDIFGREFVDGGAAVVPYSSARCAPRFHHCSKPLYSSRELSSATYSRTGGACATDTPVASLRETKVCCEAHLCLCIASQNHKSAHCSHNNGCCSVVAIFHLPLSLGWWRYLPMTYTVS